MLSQRGIAVHPGAIDSPAPNSPELFTRASASESTRRIWIITGVVILVSLVVIGAFCGVVLCMMYKKKQQRKKQTINLGGLGANHAYRRVDDLELQYSGVQELPGGNSFGPGGKKAELGGDSNEVPRVQEMDGFVAPVKPDARPAEMMGSYGYKEDYGR